MAAQPSSTHAELAAMRFVMQARLALAMGVTLACASRASLNSWAAVTAALSSLARTLRWDVRALAVVVGAERAAKHVESALAGIEAFVVQREAADERTERAEAIRRELAAVRVALDRARSSTARSAA